MNLLTALQLETRHCSAARARVGRPGEAASAPRALSVSAAATHGFSLLEVMLSVVILGLGILGLSALFAGAARQQQTSADVLQSVAIGQNTKASLNRRLGQVVGANLPDGQWQWIRARQSSVPMDPTLRIDSISPNAFFKVAAPSVTLFTNEGEFGGPPTQGVNLWTYSQNDGSVFDQNLSVMPHSRIVPSSLVVEVTVSGIAGPVGGGPIRFVDQTNQPDDIETDLITLHPEASGGSFPTNQSIRMRLAPNQGMDGAYIDSFDLSGFGFSSSDWISAIEVGAYEWKNTALLSLNERLTYVSDDRFPPSGLRPEVGLALFFRQLGEINQALVITYSLLPESRPNVDADEFPFIPPDHLDPTMNDLGVDGGPLVREVEVEIGWDSARSQYFVRVEKGPDEGWVAAPGQILLMSSRNGISSGNTNDPGADNVVRVISSQPDANPNLVRGYLSDAPRVDLTAVTPQEDNQFEQVHVYALQPTVVNADPGDDTRWRVRPVDARLIPIAIQ